MTKTTVAADLSSATTVVSPQTPCVPRLDGDASVLAQQAPPTTLITTSHVPVKSVRTPLPNM